MYKFKMDDNPDVETADQYYLSWTLTTVASLGWGFTVIGF
jgi:hypothetical protein